MLGRFCGKEVAIVGMGKSNRSLCRYLVKEGAKVTCFDRKTASELGAVYRELSGLGAHWSLGEGYLTSLPGFSSIFLTPGMKKNQPEIAEARLQGALISTETALFMDRCKARICGVTGSAGKTTTSTLIGMMLRESLPAGRVRVGGNIGEVLIEEVDSIGRDDLVVLELSSFQLELATKSPDIALVLNLKPNHLDIHSSYEEYVEAKKNIFLKQGKEGYCILNLDDPATLSMANECPGHVIFFTLSPDAARERIQAGYKVGWLEDESLMEPGGGLLAKRQDFLVPGRHNVSNALAAALASLEMGANPEGIRRAIRSFHGVPHRIEFVREIDGVRYYNDSIATSPDRTEALLEAVSGPLTLILGGYDKGIPFDALGAKIAARGCKAVTIGRTAPIIEEAIRKGSLPSAPAGMFRATSLDEAVKIAAEKTEPGGSVALSPACASYDMFANFEERGELFKELVRDLR